jgi:hypothetical protein
MITYPKAVDDEFLPMEIDYQKPAEEEIKKVTFKDLISVRKAHKSSFC